MANVVCFDFEVFRYDWGICLYDSSTDIYHKVVNDRSQLLKLYKQYENDLWVGFNSNGYDKWILKAILMGNNPWFISDFIINQKDHNGKSRYDFWVLDGHKAIYKEYPFMCFDVKSQTVQANNIGLSLKEAEANYGHSIVESNVPFDLDRPLTKEELIEVMEYCKNDVKETWFIFNEKVVQTDLRTKLDIIDMINQKGTQIDTCFALGKTLPWLISKLLGCKKLDSISIADNILRWPSKLRPINQEVDNLFRSHRTNDIYSLDVMFRDLTVTYGKGGGHGAISRYIDKDGQIVLVDLKSFYPSLIILFELFSRAIRDKTDYIKIYNDRFIYKDKGDPREYTYKIILNMTFGAMLNQYLDLYDPLMGAQIAIYGQLFITDLLETFERFGNCKIIQINTDGILLKYTDKTLIENLIVDWTSRTGLEMGLENISQVYQKDVNNYIMVDTNGKIKTKGAPVKQYGNPCFYKNHLYICTKAIVDYFVKGISVEETINNGTNWLDFQFVSKKTGKYDKVVMKSEFNEDIILLKTNRAFAAKQEFKHIKGVGMLYKTHSETQVDEKLTGAPELAFIFNQDMKDFNMSYMIDKQWYIDYANDIVKEFKGENNERDK